MLKSLVMLMEKSNATVERCNFFTEELSIYFDLVRFLAAFLVLRGHAIQDGLFSSNSSFDGFAHIAVIAFFVLSGCVISVSARRPKETIKSFIIKRAARIYSVAIPAVIFSFTVFGVSMILLPDLVINDINYPVYWVFISASLFLNELWTNYSHVPWNHPYWSLCYEVWYYVIFSCLFFLRGKSRLFFTFTFALAAGPRIMILAPIWALGVWIAYDPRLWLRQRSLGWALFIGTIVFIFFLTELSLDALVKNWFSERFPFWWRLGSSTKFVTDYLYAILFAVNFISFKAIGDSISPLLKWLEHPVRFLAGYTFSIYLFHRPITKFLAAFDIRAGNNMIMLNLFLIAIIAVCCLLFAWVFYGEKASVVTLSTRTMVFSTPCC